MDITKRRKIRDLLGEVLRGAQEIRGAGEGEMGTILGEAISDLYENRRFSRAMGAPSGAEIEDMLRQAESFCIDKLGGDGQ